MLIRLFPIRNGRGANDLSRLYFHDKFGLSQTVSHFIIRMLRGRKPLSGYKSMAYVEQAKEWIGGK